MKSVSSLLIAASTVALVTVFTVSGHAQSPDGLRHAQMHGGGMQGQGAQGHGAQGQSTQSQGMPGKGSMESREAGGTNAQMPSAGCMEMCGGMAGQKMGGMGPGAMSASSMPGPRMMQQMMPGRMADLPADRIEGRIAYLHAELRIADVQMAAWNEFAGVLRANAKRVSDARLVSAPAASKSAADRLDEQERFLAARLESVRALKPAFSKLYGSLDDSQKKTADELLGPYLGLG
jgi:hypothetical protein